MDNQVSLLGIMVEKFESTTPLNERLHEKRDWIVGRMGVPGVRENLSVICVVLDAPQDEVEALAEELNALPGVSVNMMCG